MIVTDYADDQELLTNTPAQAESLLHSSEQAAGDINLYLTQINQSLSVLNKFNLSPTEMSML